MLGKRSRFYENKETERWNKYEEYIRSQGFQLYHVRGDGNCLFRSIAHQMEQDESNHAYYRKRTVDYMRANSGKFINSLRSEEDGTWDQYLKKMEKNREWGGFLEIQALSQTLQVQIWLFQQNSTILKVGSPEYDEDDILINSHFEDRPIIYIAYSRSDRHYDSVILQNTNENNRTIRKVSIKNKEGMTDDKTIENQIIKKKVIKQKKVKEEINYQPIKKKVVQKKIKGSNFNNIVNKEETIKFKDIFLLDDKELINWCLDVKLLKKPNNCKSCRNKTGKVVYVRLSQNKKFVDKYVWRCLNKDCSWTEHIRKGNKLFDEFPRIKLRIILIYIFTHFTVLFSPIHSHKMLGISLKTIHKLSMMLSSWIINKQLKIENDIGQFGGPKSIVEIDESCFFKRKDNKGRLQKQLWGFGIVERSNGRLFVEIVPNRSSKVLVQIIEKWIKKDTKFLISDEWRAYSKLRSLGYNHEKICHRKEFVRSDNPEIHTQNIENRWGLAKQWMKRRGKISRLKFEERIKEIVWRITNRKSLQFKLLEIIVENIILE